MFLLLPSYCIFLKCWELEHSALLVQIKSLRQGKPLVREGSGSEEDWKRFHVFYCSAPSWMSSWLPVLSLWVLWMQEKLCSVCYLTSGCSECHSGACTEQEKIRLGNLTNATDSPCVAGIDGVNLERWNWGPWCSHWWHHSRSRSDTLSPVGSHWRFKGDLRKWGRRWLNCLVGKVLTSEIWEPAI